MTKINCSSFGPKKDCIRFSTYQIGSRFQILIIIMNHLMVKRETLDFDQIIGFDKKTYPTTWIKPNHLNSTKISGLYPTKTPDSNKTSTSLKIFSVCG